MREGGAGVGRELGIVGIDAGCVFEANGAVIVVAGKNIEG